MAFFVVFAVAPISYNKNGVFNRRYFRKPLMGFDVRPAWVFAYSVLCLLGLMHVALIKFPGLGQKPYAILTLLRYGGLPRVVHGLLFSREDCGLDLSFNGFDVLITMAAGH